MAVLVVTTAGVLSLPRKDSAPRPPLQPLSEQGDELFSVVSVPVADVRREANDGSELVTQALYGNQVTVVGEKNGWLEVRIREQGDYPGFVKKPEVTSVEGYLRDKRSRVTKVAVPVFDRPDQSGRALFELYGGSTPVITSYQGEWAEVALFPQGSGWVRRDSIQPPTGVSGDRLLSTAREFIGVEYLWGGMTVRGIDCSGLTYVVCAMNGLLIPRDADVQLESGPGRLVREEELRPGDLVFFSSNGKIATHVGFYEGGGKFLSALSSKGQVMTDQLNSPYWSARYFGARRVTE